MGESSDSSFSSSSSSDEHHGKRRKRERQRHRIEDRSNTNTKTKTTTTTMLPAPPTGTKCAFARHGRIGDESNTVILDSPTVMAPFHYICPILESPLEISIVYIPLLVAGARRIGL